MRRGLGMVPSARGIGRRGNQDQQKEISRSALETKQIFPAFRLPEIHAGPATAKRKAEVLKV